MKSKILLSLGLICLLLLNSCSTASKRLASWPSDMPSREFFVAHYESDLDNKKEQDVDDYLLWVLRFYKGWELYSNGWSKVTED